MFRSFEIFLFLFGSPLTCRLLDFTRFHGRAAAPMLQFRGGGPIEQLAAGGGRFKGGFDI